ncbi:MAG: tetratricopeptide repeat protein [Ignavibacteria bacterium]|nr:tetratricopeptide repeat protein [Ignavibacteria bacterium]
MKLHVSILVFLTASFAAPTASQTALDVFERGNAFYREGEFQKAVEAYEAILEQGQVSAALYYNLGNAYYRLGKLAPAILAYERGLLLDPNDPDIKHNLELANLGTVDRIEPLPKLFFVEWLHALSAVLPLRTAAWLFAACWIVLFGALATMFAFARPTFLRSLRVISLTSLVALVPLGFLLVTQVIESRSRSDAIVTASSVTAKSSPDTQSIDAFVIHEGLKVTLTDSVGEWVKIVLADGKVGWIQSRDCERI